MTRTSISRCIGVLAFSLLSCVSSYERNSEAGSGKGNIVDDTGLDSKDANLFESGSDTGADDTRSNRTPTEIDSSTPETDTRDLDDTGSATVVREAESGIGETDASNVEDAGSNFPLRKSITGHITSRGLGLEGVRVTAENINNEVLGETITNENGDYFFNEDWPWVFITPLADSYKFTPPYHELLVGSDESVKRADFEATEYSSPEHAKGQWIIVEYYGSCLRWDGEYCESGEDTTREGETLEFTDACLFEGNKCVDGFKYYSRYKIDDNPWGPRRYLTIMETEGSYDVVTQRWTITRTRITNSIGGSNETTQLVVLERVE